MDTPLTAGEFVARYDHGTSELVKGVVQTRPGPDGVVRPIRSRLTGLLGDHDETNRLGRVVSNRPWVQTRRDPDSVRTADLCFYSGQRLPRGQGPAALLTVVPDLAVEVRSPTDRWLATYDRLVEYLVAGVGVVVILDPDTVTASVYRDNELPRVLGGSDALVIPDVLPGFSVPVRRLFE